MNTRIDGNDIMARYIENACWSDFPDYVKEKAKLCLLDALCAIVAGRLSQAVNISEAYITKLFPQGKGATILLGNKQSTPEGAAFVNGCAANAMDIDDNGAYTRGHPGAQIIPVALSVGESVGASGMDVLTAIVVGYETAHRIGHIWHETRSEYQACGSWGAVANAAVAAKLMKLDNNRTKHAFGIADYHAPNVPVMRDVDHPAMVKHGIAWAAMSGIMAAGLAREGFTGVPSLLGMEKYRDWVASIGHEYKFVDGVTFKRYASCSWSHPPYVIARNLIEKNKIEIDDIDKIIVHGFHEMVSLGADLPETEEQAQFNIAWPLAAGLIDGDISPKQMLLHRLKDQSIIELANKVDLVESEELNSRYIEGSFPCEVEIQLKMNQARFSSGIQVFDSCSKEAKESETGDLRHKDDLVKKFRKYCSHVLEEQAINECLKCIEHLDQLPELKSLVDILTDRPAVLK